MTGLIRRPDWPSRLAAEIDRLQAEPFAWGSNDCLTGLMHGVVMAVTGEDVTRPWRNRYTTAVGALRVMRNDGFGDLAELAGSVLPKIHPSRVQTGDIAAIPSGDSFGFGLGVVNGATVALMTERGIHLAPIADAAHTFAVGRGA